MKTCWLRRLLAMALVLGVSAVHALTPAEALTLAAGDSDERIATLNRLAAAGDTQGLTLIQALSNDAVKVQGEQVLVIAGDGSAADAVSGAAATLSETAEDAVVNNRMRSAIETALATRDLFGTDAGLQREAATLLQKAAFDEPDASQLPLVAKALANTALDAQARQSLELAARRDAAGQRRPGQAPGGGASLAGRPRRRRAQAAAERPGRPKPKGSASVQGRAERSDCRLDRSLAITSGLSQAFTGISLGSILLLAALGLAITYGLMGVINMAHGELIMIGAYATWLVQAFFKSTLPDFFDWYLLAAMPVAFTGVGPGGRGDGAHGDPLPLRPSAGNAAGHLGHQPGADAGCAQPVRRAERGRGKPQLDERQRHPAGQPHLPWNRILIVGFAAAVLIGVTLLISQDTAGPVRARRHAEPPHRQLHGREHRPH